MFHHIQQFRHLHLLQNTGKAGPTANVDAEDTTSDAHNAKTICSATIITREKMFPLVFRQRFTALQFVAELENHQLTTNGPQ